MKLLLDELLLLLLLRNKLLLLTLLLLGSKLLLLGLLLSRPGPGCEDQLKLIRSDVDLLRLCSALLTLGSELALLLLLGQQLLLLLLLSGEQLLLLLLLNRPVDVELCEPGLPRLGDLVLDEADLLLALVQELLLLCAELQRLKTLLDRIVSWWKWIDTVNPGCYLNVKAR